MYVAALTGPDRFAIIDAASGIRVNTVSTGGKIINGPVVTGDKVTVIIQRSDTAKLGKIYNMPSGSLQTQFSL
jgi:hypothetical protein